MSEPRKRVGQKVERNLTGSVIVDVFGKEHLLSDIRELLVEVSILLHGEGTKLYPHQEFAILEAFRLRDSIISIATSGGKTACFEGLLLLYDLLYNGSMHSTVRLQPGDPGYKQIIVLVASPLTSLMGSMSTKFLKTRAAQRLGLKAFATAGVEAESKEMARIINSPNSALILSSPEVLTQVGHPLQKALSTLPIVAFAVDEAHVVLEWGTETEEAKAPFRPAYGRLGRVRSFFCASAPPVMALSEGLRRIPNILKMKKSRSIFGAADGLI